MAHILKDNRHTTPTRFTPTSSLQTLDFSEFHSTRRLTHAHRNLKFLHPHSKKKYVTLHNGGYEKLNYMSHGPTLLK